MCIIKTCYIPKTETDGLISNIIVSNYYNKNESDTLLGNKLDATVYNTGITLKAHISDMYNKNLLYTKTVTDSLISNINLANYYKK